MGTIVAGEGARGAGDALPETLIDWEGLLNRPPVPEQEDALAAAFTGRRVLITGAGGSLGRALTACVARYAPAALTLVDSHEPSLFALRGRLLEERPAVEALFRLTDVRNRRRVARLFAATRPEVVYHLAAYKHVPWAEEDPVEYVEANLGGGRAVAEEAAAAGVGRLVYPSTDKAVNPPSLYGATKRIMEAQLREVAAGSALRATAARFVNVLGSQGSVGVTFARQIVAGQPPTLIPGMTRYWIGPRHATLLLAYAAGPAFAEPFTVVLPEARPAIPVEAILERVWRALRPDAGAPPVAPIGPRPGERLAEELIGAGEALEPGPYPGVLEVQGGAPAPPGRPVARGIGDLLALAGGGLDPAELKARTLAWARGLV